MKMVKLVDVNNGQIIDYNEQTAQLLLERNAARYMLPENVSLGIDATTQQKLDLQNAILFNQGKSEILAKDFKDDASAKVVLMLNNEIEKLKIENEELKNTNETLKNALNLAAKSFDKVAQDVESKSEQVDALVEEIIDADTTDADMTDAEVKEEDREALEALTVKELKAFAEKESIALDRNMKKDDIVSAILQTV